MYEVHGTYTLHVLNGGRLYMTIRNDQGESVSEVTIGADYSWTLTPLPALSEQLRAQLMTTADEHDQADADLARRTY